MSGLKLKIGLLFVAVLVVVVLLFTPDKDAETKKEYLHSLNFEITGVVKQVMPLRDEDHGYGVIYLQSFRSNKENQYDCAFKTKYLFCKINNNEAIIVTPGVTEIKPNDSVYYNTKFLLYKVYRQGKLIIENGIALNDDDDFYNTLVANDYLDFSYYHNK